MKKITKAIITAAGFGSRFLPITKTFPKELVPILEKPILQYVIEECIGTGIEEVIIVAGEADVKTYEDYFYGRATSIRTLMIRQNKLERWSKVEKIFDLPKITIIPQDERLPYGNGRPVLSAKDLVKNEDAFITMFGDDMTISKISAVSQLINFYNENPCDGVLQVTKMPKEHLIQGGVLKIKKGTTNQLETVVEKPPIDNLPSDLYSFGRFVMTKKIFDYLKPDATGRDDELWLQDANAKLAKNGRVLFQILDGKFVTTGDPFNYLKALLEVVLTREDLKTDFLKYLHERLELE